MGRFATRIRTKHNTIRQGSTYLSRMTLAYARRKQRLAGHLELLRCHYNFPRPHLALNFGCQVRTPAWPASNWRSTSDRDRNDLESFSRNRGFQKLAEIKMIDVWIPTVDQRWLILPRYTQPSPDTKLLIEKLRLELPDQPPPRLVAQKESNEIEVQPVR
jgi:hypothetical protein